MFNEAFSVGETATGNPACTQNTVERLTGLRVDHTVVVDFKGFAAMTKVVGGVDVCVPETVYERDLDPTSPRGQGVFAEGRAEGLRAAGAGLRPDPARHRRRLGHRPDQAPAGLRG